MKKTLLLLASAVLLLVGCQKEQIAEKNVGGEGLQTVSFTVGVESAATKAVADEDGKAAKINHWVMQVLDSDDAVYNYQEDDGPTGTKTHTFEVPLVKGQTYKVLFWADTKGAYNTANLKEISKACFTANADSLDAFSAVINNFSTTQATQQAITLKRPFAQLNVVFTDLKKLYQTMGDDTEYGKFVPVNFVAKAKVPTSFNVLTQEAGAPAETALEMTAATDYLGNYMAKKDTSTLYMDYIFASTTKDIVDIDFSFVSKGVAIAHNFAAVPFQRNYRTNILSDLMSANAKWVVTVDSDWDSLEDGSKDYNVNYYEPSSITDAQKYIENNDDQKSKVVDLSKYTVTANDYITSEDKKIEFKLKTTSPEDMVNFTLPEIPEEFITAGCAGWKITHESGYPTQNVNVTAPQGTLVTIDAPRSHVTLNGSVYDQVTATTGPSTLVVPAGVTVKNLTVKEGGVEIHGCVEIVSVTGTAETVFVRECENLSETVYNALKNYIDPRYCSKENDTTPKTYDIVLNAVAEINGVTYPTLAEAVAAANTGDVVKLVKNIDQTAQVEVSGKEISLNLNGKTIEYKGAQLKSGILLVHNGAGLTINGEGLIKSGTGAYAAIALTKSGDNANNPAKLTVNGGNIEGNYYGIVGNGTRHNTQIVINNGTITSTDAEATAIYHPQNGTLTINGGMIKGDNGLYIKSGTVANISGATIEATGAKGEYGYSGSGFNSTGDAIIVDNCNYPGGRPTVTIGDATLISAHGFQVGAYFSAPETGISDIYKTVNTAFTVPEGYEWNEDGKLVKKPISVTSQSEFNNAISSATTGDIIEIKATGEYTVPNIPNNVTIKGGDGVVFNCVGSGSIASIPNGATFENVTMNMGQAEYHGFHHAGYIQYKNCVINGYYKTYGVTKFDGCTFNQDTYAYCLNAYGMGIDVVNCVFNNLGKAFYCYNEGNDHYTVNFTGCTFNVTYDSKAKSQIFVKNNVAKQKYTVNISDCQIGTSNKTIEEYKNLDLDPDLTNGKGDLRLWNVEEGTTKGQYVVVTLDGETVYSYGSLE